MLIAVSVSWHLRFPVALAPKTFVGKVIGKV